MVKKTVKSSRLSFIVITIVITIIVLCLYHGISKKNPSNSKAQALVLVKQDLVFEIYTTTSYQTPKEYYEEKIQEVYREISRIDSSKLSKEDKKYINELNQLVKKYKVLSNPAGV